MPPSVLFAPYAPPTLENDSDTGFSGIGVLPVRCLVGVGLDALDAICSGVKEPVLVITGVSNSLHLLGVGLEGRLSPS